MTLGIESVDRGRWRGPTCTTRLDASMNPHHLTPALKRIDNLAQLQLSEALALNLSVYVQSKFVLRFLLDELFHCQLHGIKQGTREAQ